MGDNEMHTFRDTWDNILRNMVDNLAEISKRDLLFRKMESSKELSEDMAIIGAFPKVMRISPMRGCRIASCAL
jgi:hypothetical protein